MRMNMNIQYPTRNIQYPSGMRFGRCFGMARAEAQGRKVRMNIQYPISNTEYPSGEGVLKFESSKVLKWGSHVGAGAADWGRMRFEAMTGFSFAQRRRGAGYWGRLMDTNIQYSRDYLPNPLGRSPVRPERATHISVGQRPTFGGKSISSPVRAWASTTSRAHIARALSGLICYFARFRRALPYAVPCRPFGAKNRGTLGTDLSPYNYETFSTCCPAIVSIVHSIVSIVVKDIHRRLA